MASRMKKLFLRKKDEETEVLPQRTRGPPTARSNPAIRTSLYESTAPARLPQTGDYPIKGNDSSVILQAGRKSSVRSRRSLSRGSQNNTPYQAPTPNQNDVARKTPRMSPSPSNVKNSGPYHTYDPYQDTSSPMSGHDDRRLRSSGRPFDQEFAGLNLGTGQGTLTIECSQTSEC